VSLLTDERATRWLAAAALLALAGLGAVLIAVELGWTTSLDHAALAVAAGLHGSPIDPLMVTISEFGVADILGFFSMMSAGLLWSIGLRRAALFVGAGYYLVAIVTDVLKTAVARPRPPAVYQVPLQMPETEDLIWAALAVLLIAALWRTRFRWGAVIGATLFALTIFIDPVRSATPGIDSFPSGHAMRSIALVVTVLIAVPWRPGRRTSVLLALAVLAIGVSRVYLGEHHPTDVLAGWLAGVAFACAFALVPAFRTMEEPAEPHEIRGGQRPAG
jgi:membrane-associated phospholipid phosphatase